MSGFSGLIPIFGTWTPVFSSAGGTLSVQPTINDASYMKIGPWFIGSLDFTIASLGAGSPTGACNVTLPFAPAQRGWSGGFEQALTGSNAMARFAATVASLQCTMADGTTLFVAGRRFVSSDIVFRI